MRCVILQPSYIPWRGYFDLIHDADLFVFYDDVQYDRRGWRNRNRVRTPRGTDWLTIPVKARGAQTEHIPILEIETAGDDWPREHLATLTRLYGKAPFFERYRAWLEDAYASPPRLLADFTIATTIAIARVLGITTEFVRSSTLHASGTKTDRLLDVCRKVGATRYLSGPSARDYIEEEKFEEAGIALEWKSYGYPDYAQLHPGYDPFVTILDLLFMTGDEAPRFIWS